MVELYVGLGAECHNSTRRSVGLHLGQFDTCQAQPETAAAGSLVQLLSDSMRRALSWEAVMSAWGGAVVEEVQELRGLGGAGVGEGGGAGGGSDLW